MVVWAAALPALKAAAPAVAKFAGSALGSVAGQALGGLFGGSSGGTDVGSSKALMQYQMDLQKDYNQWLNENQYTHMRTGLEKAGYNPLLAIGSGVSPANGSVGLGSAVSGNTASFDGEKAIEGLLKMAQLKNIEADTDSKNAGILSRFLGSERGRKLGNAIDDLISRISNRADYLKASDDVGEMVLKGYVSNTANAPNDLPSGMFTYQPDLDEQGDSDLKELKMIKKIERRRKRYGL